MAAAAASKPFIADAVIPTGADDTFVAAPEAAAFTADAAASSARAAVSVPWAV